MWITIYTYEYIYTSVLQEVSGTQLLLNDFLLDKYPHILYLQQTEKISISKSQYVII